MPQAVGGFHKEPLVSVPIAIGIRPAATAAAGPLDEPPGMQSVLHGFLAGGQGKSNEGPPVANSYVANFPSKIPPAFRQTLVISASE